jgi:type II secretory pathway pseudopilin PulG
MKKSARPSALRSTAGFSIVEIMVTMTIVMLVMGMALSTFVFCLKAMYKDTQRLATNAALRAVTAQVSKETLDATEFYVFPNYQTLDGNINLVADYSAASGDTFGTDLFNGDCLVLVTRETTDATSNIRQFRIYYRYTTSPDTQAPLRYIESTDFGTAGSTSTLTTLLNLINLKTTPVYPVSTAANVAASRQLAANVRGRLKSTPPAAGSGLSLCYPVFSTESINVTPTNISVSINMEIINGTTANNMISSSSFNYTISPRR